MVANRIVRMCLLPLGVLPLASSRQASRGRVADTGYEKLEGARKDEYEGVKRACSLCTETNHWSS